MTPKILSVDDSKMIHMVIGKAFKPFDAQVFFASNGMEGLAVATRENPDVILLDVTMPVMDGVETLTKLKADPCLKNIPVLMLTAEAGKEHVVKIAKIGIRDYVIKPFTEQLIVERVGRIINLQMKGSSDGRGKTIDDPANVLVIDDKPAIIEQITHAVTAETPWTVTGVSNCGEGVEVAGKTPPDIILVSLSLPDRAAMNFFQMMRANVRMKGVPIFGLSVKTAVDEQNTAQTMGFSGIVTKPLDMEELLFRMTRAMHIDTSARYFKEEEGIQYLRVPKKINDVISNEVNTYIGPKTQEMVDSGRDRLIIDLSQIEKIEMSVIKLILLVVQTCRQLSIKVKVVASPQLAEQSKTFQETKDLEIFDTRDSALATF